MQEILYFDPQTSNWGKKVEFEVVHQSTIRKMSNFFLNHKISFSSNLLVHLFENASKCVKNYLFFAVRPYFWSINYKF